MKHIDQMYLFVKGFIDNDDAAGAARMLRGATQEERNWVLASLSADYENTLARHGISRDGQQGCRPRRATFLLTGEERAAHVHR